MSVYLGRYYTFITISFCDTNADYDLQRKNIQKVHLIYQLISEELSNIDRLKYVKIYNGRIKASNMLSQNGKKEPITKIGEENIIGVELLIDIPNKIIQFYSITSSVKGYGDKMVSAIISSTPKDWEIVVVIDWSLGFWQVMAERYPRLEIF
ncbi:MAG: hypothetical protein A6F70_10120 [Cycloclasticus sp. symbiont of Bathymodiolus heckerae]|nr:MAG: hypothetical protein A6F70_10120 [Cycloclasticus sp. symbiont of Bathymodiolus heckerae]